MGERRRSLEFSQRKVSVKLADCGNPTDPLPASEMTTDGGRRSDWRPANTPQRVLARELWQD